MWRNYKFAWNSCKISCDNYENVGVLSHDVCICTWYSNVNKSPNLVFVLETFLPGHGDVFIPSWRRFCPVLETSWFGFSKTLWRRPGNVLKPICKDVLGTFWARLGTSINTPKARFHDVFITSNRGLGGLHFATDIRFLRRHGLVLREDVLKTSS